MGVMEFTGVGSLSPDHDGWEMRHEHNRRTAENKGEEEMDMGMFWRGGGVEWMVVGVELSC